MTIIDGLPPERTAPAQPTLPADHVPPRGHALRDLAHPRCVACSPRSGPGLKLEFHEIGDGGVRATFNCAAVFEGYPGCLHGGIVSTILDSAMANCLFAQGHQAVTAELSVRFRAPVALEREAVTIARATRDLFPLFLMEASLSQEGETKATATAKFIIPKGL
jgi:acyl-coenzyme A thioesterase PaaI-like protein